MVNAAGKVKPIWELSWKFKTTLLPFDSLVFPLFDSYPPASKGSREVANLIERKNPHTPVYGVKEFVCLSVRLSITICHTNFTSTYFLYKKFDITSSRASNAKLFEILPCTCSFFFPTYP